MSADDAILVIGILTLVLIVLIVWVNSLDAQLAELIAWRYERDAERLRCRERGERVRRERLDGF